MDNQLHKSNQDKMILGVCGGVAEYFEVDSSLVRIIWAVASFVFGTGIILYLIAAIILPYGDESQGTNYEGNKKTPNVDRSSQRKVIGLVLIAGGLFILLRNFAFYIDFDYVFSAFLVVLGIVVIFKGREKNSKDEE